MVVCKQMFDWECKSLRTFFDTYNIWGDTVNFDVVYILLVTQFRCRLNLGFCTKRERIFESGKTVVVFTIPSLVKMLLNHCGF